MHRTTLQKFSIIVVFAALAFLSMVPEMIAGSSAGSIPHCSHRDRDDVFRDFLATLYPELRRDWASLSVKENSAFSVHQPAKTVYLVTVSLNPPDCGVPGVLPGNSTMKDRSQEGCSAKASDSDHRGNGMIFGSNKEVLLKGNFTFDHNKARISNFVNYTASKKLFDAQQTVQEHPDWTDERIIEELRAAGAAFGPWNRKGLLSKVSTNALTPFFGKLQVTSSEFRVVERVELPDNADAPPFPMMWWEVRLDPVNTAKYHYVMTFEPFEGKLMMIRAIKN